MKKFVAEKNMDNGETLLSKTVVGKNLPDAFMDSYFEEARTCYDIINEIERYSNNNYLVVKFDKSFLKKIIRSYIFHIKEMEKFKSY